MEHIQYTAESLEKMNQSLNDGLNNGTIRSEPDLDSSGRIVGVSLVRVPPAGQVQWPRPVRVCEGNPVSGQRVLLSTNRAEYVACIYDAPGFVDENYMEFEINESSVWLPAPPKPE